MQNVVQLKAEAALSPITILGAVSIAAMLACSATGQVDESDENLAKQLSNPISEKLQNIQQTLRP